MNPRFRLIMVTVAVVTVGTAYAQNPASITAPANGKAVAHDLNGGLDPADGEIILDQLCVYDHPWEIGNGNTCGGAGIFGFDYDLQAAEDFELVKAGTLTGFVCDYVQFGDEKASTLCISVYAGECDSADETPMFYVETAPDAVISLHDIHEYLIWRYVVKQELCDLGPGRYYISMNPKMVNWGLSLALYTNDGCGDFTCDVLLRDGQDDNPCCDGADGYGYPDWTPSRNYWAGHTTVTSCQVQVRFADTPRCIYTVKKVRSPADLCGQVCAACPYRPGDLICTNTCANGEGECAGVLRGASGCADGNACKIVAVFTACAETPGDCDRCVGGGWAHLPRMDCRLYDGYHWILQGTYDENEPFPITIEKWSEAGQWVRVGDDAKSSNGQFTWRVPGPVMLTDWIRPSQLSDKGRPAQLKKVPICD